MCKRDHIANSLNTVGFLEVKTKCQEHNISGLLSWVLFYSASLLFKQHRKSWKCNIHFYTASIFIHGAVWNSGFFFFFSLSVWGEGGSGDWATARFSFFFLAENLRCWLFSRVWAHGVFSDKRCGDGRGVGVDPRRSRHTTADDVWDLLLVLLRLNIWESTTWWTYTHTHTHRRCWRKSWERARSRASLNLYFGILKKKKLDLRELPKLGPNEYFFSNMGSLIMKYGPRPWILYRLELMTEMSPNWALQSFTMQAVPASATRNLSHYFQERNA